MRRLCAAVALSGLIVGSAQALPLGTMTPAAPAEIADGRLAQIAVDVQPDVEHSQLRVELADRRAHVRAGINPAEQPEGLSVQLANQAAVPVIVVTAAPSAIAADLAFGFLLKLQWPDGQLLRAYQLQSGADGLMASAASDSQFGPTRRADTLFSIANAVKPAEVGTNQMMLALLAQNPRAFNAPNVNALQRGVRLSVPAAERLELVALSEANAQVASQHAQWPQEQEQGRRPAPASSAASASTPIVRVLPVPASNPAAIEQREQLAEELARISATNERLLTRNDALQTLMQDLRRDVDQLEQLLIERSGVASVQSIAEPLPASEAVVSTEAVLAWAKAQWRAALRDPQQALTQPLVRWSSIALAALALVILIWALRVRAVRRRQARAQADALPDHWRPGDGRSDLANRESAEVGLDATVHNDSPADPLEQASSLIAYGQLAGAQSILDEALGEAPDSIDLRVRLLDVLAMRNDRAGFEAEAHVLHAQLDDINDPRWQRVARQGRDLSPEHALFADSQ